MEANDELYFKIRDGYRSEKPAIASDQIYDIMLSCWNVNPESRPSFSDLERIFGAMMNVEIVEVNI